MDLRDLCVFVAVFVDVSARITCNFQPKTWTSAMLHCLYLRGTAVGISSVLSPTGLHLNGSFWTADYASKIATTDSPVECEYQTLALFNQISLAKLGNCEVIRNYICCDNNITIFKTGTTLQQTTETLAETIMSINDTTSTESIVRNNASSSSASALGIGLGASLSMVVIVIITMVSVCVYKRRKRKDYCEGSIKESGLTELGDLHVYDEIINNEESAYAASKVDIYDKIRSDGEKEHAYASLTSVPKY